MKIVGLMLVRNEEWILGFSLRAALVWCDEVIVCLHDCSDRTEEIVREVQRGEPGRVFTMVADGEWLECDFRQQMLQHGRGLGGTHFALIDADEAITGGGMVARIREEAPTLHEGQALAIPMIACWRGLLQHRIDTDSPWGSTQTPVLIADSSSFGWAAREGYQLHSRLPHGAYAKVRRPFTDKSQGGMFHLQWVNWERLLWKQRHYVLRERLQYGYRDNAKTINARYSASVDEKTLETAPTPLAWWRPYAYITQHINLGAEAGWHKAYCEAGVRALPFEALAGLDLFGWTPPAKE